MANTTKKVFQIVINGLTESIDAVKSLNNELDSLGDKIKALDKSTIKVKVEGNKENASTKTKVSGNTAVDAAEKQRIKNEQDILKYQQLTTEEGKKQLIQAQEIQKQLKEQKQLAKDIAEGAKDIDGNYTNTLAGLRAKIRDLKNENKTGLLDADTTAENREQINALSEMLKRIEGEMGQFQSNVGDYENAIKRALNGMFDPIKTEGQSAIGSINDLTERLKKARSAMEGAAPDSKAFKDAKKEVDELKGKLDELVNGAKEGGAAMEDALGIKFSTTIEGIKYTFDDVNQAIGILEDKLYSMAQAGDKSSKTFKAIQQEIVRLRKNVISVDASIDGMVTSSKGLRTVLNIVQGFSGVAALGQGIMGLFGGQSEELDNTIRKFASLSLVLQGIQQIQQQIETDTEGKQPFTKFWNGVSESVDKAGKSIGNFITKIPGVSKAMDAVGNAWENLNKKIEASENNPKLSKQQQQYVYYLDMVTEYMNRFSTKVGEAYSKVENLHEGDNKTVKTLEDIAAAVKDVENGTTNASEAAREYVSAVQEEVEGNKELSGYYNSSLEKLGKFPEEMKSLSSSIKGFGKNMLVVAKSTVAGVKAIGTAFKTLAKATVFLAIINSLTEAIGWLWDKLVGLTGDADRVDQSFSDVQSQTEAMSSSLAEAIRLINNEQITQGLSKWQALQKQLQAIGETATKSGQALQELAEKNAQWITYARDYADTWGFSTASKDAEEFKKTYQELLNAVQKGQDVLSGNDKDNTIGGWFKSLFLTAKDARTDLAEMQEAIIKDVAYDLSKIDYSEPARAYKEFQRIITDETNASALQNVDKLFPGQEWAKILKERIEQFKQFGMQYIQAQDQLANEAKTRTRDIAQLYIDAMADGTAKIKAQAAEDRKKAREDYGDDEELLKAHLAAINRREKNQLESTVRNAQSQAKQLADIQNQINQNRLDIMNEGLEKIIKQLELQKKQELANAQDAGKLTGELRLSIEAKYDKKILDARKNYFRDRTKLLEEFHNENFKRLNQYRQEILNISQENAETENDILSTDAESSKNRKTLSFSFDVEKTGTKEGTEEQQKYYDNLLKAEEDYIKRKQELDKNLELKSYQTQTEQMRIELDNRIKDLSDYFEAQQEKTENAVKQGLITQQEADEQISKVKRDVEQQQLDLTAQYTNKQSLLSEQHLQKLKQIEEKGQEDITKVQKDALSNRLTAYSEAANEIQRKVEEGSQKNSLGMINYSKERKALKKAKEEYTSLLDTIDNEYTVLQEKLDNKQITFGDFKEAKKQLDDLKKSTKDAAKEVNKSLKTLFADTVKSIFDGASQYVDAFSNLYGQWNDLLNSQFDAQQSQLDKEADLLDKEYDMLEDKYQKQEELTQQHTDKINDIEDELKDARGDRRQHLIDALAAEREEQLASLKEQTEIEKQKEENQRKQDANEKKQDALDKKRKEQQKRLSIVQATINTYTAVNNALAVQPWFVGLALSSVALAMGLANVAAISKQKYANGGLLYGRRHSEGGIPVGNTGIEVEGGEYVVNRKSTEMNAPLIDYINSSRRTLTKKDLVDFYDDGKGNGFVNSPVRKMYAEGGELSNSLSDLDIRRLINAPIAQDNRPIVVSVVDINNAQDNLREVQTLAGL